MAPYLVAAAAAIAVFGIIIAYRKSHQAILEGQSNYTKIQNKFFMNVAIIEALPIILIIFGFMMADGQTFSMAEIYIPLAIVIALIIFSVFIVFSQISQATHLQRSNQIDTKTLNIARSMSIMALALANAIPIVSLVFMLMFVNQ